MTVKTSYLSKEELERVRLDAKCDLDKRPPKQPIDWKWPKKKAK